MKQCLYPFLMMTLLLAGCAAESPHVAAAVPAAPPQVEGTTLSVCTTNDLQLTLDASNGDFNGMSHTGTYLLLKNIGSRTCTLPRRPAAIFFDATGAALNAHASVPPGMHPGPALVPVRLTPGATAKSGLRWVSGDVYGGGTCAGIAIITVKLDGGELSAPLQSHICGPQGKGMSFEEPWLQLSSSPR